MLRQALLLSLTTACTRPPEAPSELDDLARYLYRTWGDEDERVQVAGLTNLEVFLEGADEGAGLTDKTGIQARSWELELLEPDDVANLPERPDRDLGGMIALGVAHDSPHPIACHATVQTLVDQLPVEKSSATDYTRTFLDEEDGDCFPSADCDVLRTNNDIRRANLFFAARFDLRKDFRWFELEDGRTAFYSRSWLPTSFPGEDGEGMMWQSYSIDVWIERPGQRSWRWQVLWTETDTGESFPEGAELGAIKSGTDRTLRDGDAVIVELDLCP